MPLRDIVSKETQPFSLKYGKHLDSTWMERMISAIFTVVVYFHFFFFIAPASSPIQEGSGTPSSGEPLWFRGGKRELMPSPILAPGSEGMKDLKEEIE